MKGDLVVIKPAVAQKFKHFVDYGRVLFFSAPCGFGKSAVASALLEGRSVLSLSAAARDFVLPSAEGSWRFLLLDDLQAMQEETDWQTLCELVRASPDRRFVFLSRGRPPGSFMAFQYTGLMTVLDADALLFDRGDVKLLLERYQVSLPESEVSDLLQESGGYPLGIVVAANLLVSGKPFGPKLVAQGVRELFLYFESNIYQRFDLPIRRFLLELSPFEAFDTEMARVVSGNPRAGELLEWLQRNTTMLLVDDIGCCHFWPRFRTFLLWEMEQEYTEAKRRALFNRGGLYYELKEDYHHALECYERGGDRAKVSEVLIRNAELHPGMGYYSEMERYYRALPESEVLASPALMQGMSMLCALAVDYDGSERWYNALKQFAKQRGSRDAAGKQARSRLAWLDISLPQRGVESLLDTIPLVFHRIHNREVKLPPISVTSALPSVMNGGKDFSAWSKRDDFLYQTLRRPLESVMGRDGVGLADCAIAESKFEKGEDISVRILSLLPRMEEIQNKGTPDIKFAVTGLMTRSQLAAGCSDDARHTIDLQRENFAENGLTRFLPNADALRCRIDLYTGDLDAADRWYWEKAPRDPIHLNVMKRYQYLTQAMVELALGMPDAVLLTLAPLEPYFVTCERHIDRIHLHTLKAVALYRKKDEGWSAQLTAALEIAPEYHFIRTVGDYGAAVLPLLDGFAWSGDEKWYKQLMGEVRMCAAYYPRFLQPRLAPHEELTDTEKQVLRLLCADKSNAEIGTILNIKLTTVKTHVSHILDKLGVNRRSAAKTAAQHLRLIPEDW